MWLSRKTAPRVPTKAARVDSAHEHVQLLGEDVPWRRQQCACCIGSNIGKWFREYPYSAPSAIMRRFVDLKIVALKNLATTRFSDGAFATFFSSLNDLINLLTNCCRRHRRSNPWVASSSPEPFRRVRRRPPIAPPRRRLLPSLPAPWSSRRLYIAKSTPRIPTSSLSASSSNSRWWYLPSSSRTTSRRPISTSQPSRTADLNRSKKYLAARGIQ